MTWQLFDKEIVGNQAQVLLNDQFAGYNPGEALPVLQALHPEYRIEYDVKPDPDWSCYFARFKETPNA